MEPKQELPGRIRVDFGMKGDSTFLRAPGLVPHHQMQFSIISRTLIECVEDLTPLQKCS